ncbi:Ger(x)C family spore germination protein [Lysinibacillus fusiformis]|uniref:Ger(x)C family spore germination protein n=1 Tax=Lysinibacillus fusiformis TaxID=28031 RepID=UPI000D36B565|nr:MULTISPECIES: Ger(x)C family spore germination protein [Lysinibacillus]MED4669729.1 Ger(x)C family spore germination protein [Lysinibacillus fusiformis]QAS55770.1 Ger(x)C family spore germination protein [Lysinibacillus sphaericus]RDV24953.1 Ger(x)C family spore germination protein [Lysinibacillus fusiformis]GED66104.1 germination protein GerC [Lysinibacillus fusiformis]
MVRKRILCSIIVVSVAICMSGCWDATEPQRMYYVNAVGVDYEDNKYKVYLQIINLADIANVDNNTGNATSVEVGYAEGKTIEEAIYKLYRSSDQEIFWGHMRYLLFSERAMKTEQNTIPVIDTFIRFRETRYQIWVFCTTDSIKDVMLIAPILRSSITSSKLSSPLKTIEQESFIDPKNLRELVIGLNEPSHEVTIPFVTIMKNWETEAGETEETSFAGIGILSKDEFKGFIKDSLSRGSQWMQDKTNRGRITFKLSGRERDYLTVDIDKLNVDVKPIIKKKESETVVFDIDIHVKATVNGFKGAIKDKHIKKHIKEQIKKEVMETYEEGLKLDADIYRLSEYLYRSNVKVWQMIEKDGKIPLKKESINKINIYVKINAGRKTFEETIKE